MLTIFLLVALAAAVAALLVAIHRGATGVATAAKISASFLFLLLAALRFTAGDPFDRCMIAALFACAIGDVLLLGSRTFDLGLGAFLLGHLGFAAAFALRLHPAHWHPTILTLLLVLAGVVAAWLWSHLGRRRIPVLLYIAAITLMVWGAASLAIAGALSWWTSLGAALFMVSDIWVARQRFVRASFLNRAVGLPMYYGGQVLLALAL